MDAEYVVNKLGSNKDIATGKFQFENASQLKSKILGLKIQKGYAAMVTVPDEIPRKLIPIVKELKNLLGSPYSVAQSGYVIAIEKR